MIRNADEKQVEHVKVRLANKKHLTEKICGKYFSVFILNKKYIEYFKSSIDFCIYDNHSLRFASLFCNGDGILLYY